MKVAVIGAGVSAAAAVGVLQAHGCDVSVFEKSRGPGGRFGSKRVGQQLSELGTVSTQSGYADFGAQYFTARDPMFIAQVQQWQQQGLIRLWPQTIYRYSHGQLAPSPDCQPRYIAVPQMQQLLKPIFSAVDSHYDCRIHELSYVYQQHPQRSDRWQLASDAGDVFSGYDALLLTCPAEQSRQLLQGAAIVSQIPAQPLLPCWAVLLELAEPTLHPADAIFISDHALRFVAKQNGKTDRAVFSLQTPVTTSAEQWMVHLSAEASEALLSASHDQVIEFATAALAEVLGNSLQVRAVLAHRWLYASYAETVPPCGVLVDANMHLAVAGDWTLGGRVENAWLSGQQAASLLLNGGRR